MACAIISAPRVNQPAHQRTNQGVVLDISPPARPVTATRSIDFSQRSHAPKFTGSAVDRYRARSNVDAAIRSNTASSSSSQNEMASKQPVSVKGQKCSGLEARKPDVVRKCGPQPDVAANKNIAKSDGPNVEATTNDANSTASSRKSVSYSKRVTKSTGRSTIKIPISRLSLMKPTKTSSSIIHHPNPYAARNMYYDERWIEKQENGFKKWLNFVLTPPDGFECSENDRVLLAPGKLDVAKLWNACTKDVRVPRAPTREVLSMRAYSAQRQLKQLRREASTLWQSPSIAPVSFIDYISKLLPNHLDWCGNNYLLAWSSAELLLVTQDWDWLPGLLGYWPRTITINYFSIVNTFSGDHSYWNGDREAAVHDQAGSSNEQRCWNQETDSPTLPQLQPTLVSIVFSNFILFILRM